MGLVFGIVAMLVALGVVAGGGLVYGRTQLEAQSPTHGKAVTIQVGPGESLDQVVADLDGRGLIKSPFWFKLYARYKGLAGGLHPGQYRVDDGMGASAIVGKLIGVPDVHINRLVLTEGMTAAQMAHQVETTLGIPAAQYLREVGSGTFSEPFLAGRPPGASLEGFLFPDSYDIPATATAHDVVQRQLDSFAGKGAPALTTSRNPQNLSTYQLVVLASLVEREARDPADRGLVAGVLDNRLAKGMLLQVDASVLYGVGAVGRSPTTDELAGDTPYNTYLHPGLPPTPIANPGHASLLAAAQPASTNALFYVSDGCGHNHYARTDAEQEDNKRKYVGTPCPS